MAFSVSFFVAHNVLSLYTILRKIIYLWDRATVLPLLNQNNKVPDNSALDNNQAITNLISSSKEFVMLCTYLGKCDVSLLWMSFGCRHYHLRRNNCQYQLIVVAKRPWRGRGGLSLAFHTYAVNAQSCVNSTLGQHRHVICGHMELWTVKL